MPTCIIVGEKDLLKGVGNAGTLKNSISHAEYHVLMDAGHAACREKSQEFNSVLLGFLA